jgi:CRISPR-associated endonuclease/helicase Cas3
MGSKMNVDEALLSVVKKITHGGKPRAGLLNACKEKGPLILSAPPGYGKTTIAYTLGLLSATDMKYAVQSIHVLPMRSIIEDVYERMFSNGGLGPLNERSAGMQMMGSHMSPNLQKPYLITTIDTYLLGLLRIPPGEAKIIEAGYTLGHGEYVRALVPSSTIIFDEIQLYMEDSQGVPSALFSICRFLYTLGAQIILMSATVPDILVNCLQNEIGGIRVMKYGRDFIDKDFNEKEKAKKIYTRKEKGSLLKRATRFSYDNSGRIGIVVNTVKKAIELAKELEDLDPIILHRRLKAEEKINRLKALSKKNDFLVISTQVIEAGVNISFDYLLTEASTPSSLVQRCGRVARFDEDEEGEVLVVLNEEDLSDDRYTVYPSNLVKMTFKNLEENLEWHLPTDYEGFMNKAYLESGFQIKVNRKLMDDIEAILVNPKEAKSALDLQRTYGGSVIREDILIPAFLNELDLKPGCCVDEYMEELLQTMIPLSGTELNRLAKTIKLLYITTGKEFKIEELRTKPSILFLEDQKALGVLLPLNLYDEKLGLKIP